MPIAAWILSELHSNIRQCYFSKKCLAVFVVSGALTYSGLQIFSHVGLRGEQWSGAQTLWWNSRAVLFRHSNAWFWTPPIFLQSDSDQADAVYRGAFHQTDVRSGPAQQDCLQSCLAEVFVFEAANRMLLGHQKYQVLANKEITLQLRVCLSVMNALVLFCHAARTRPSKNLYTVKWCVFDVEKLC